MKCKSTKKITERCFSCQNKSVCQKLAGSSKKWKSAKNRYTPFWHKGLQLRSNQVKCFLDILVLFKLDLGQISFIPVQNAFATQQLAFLATGIVFYHNVTRACARIKILRLFLDEEVTYVFRLFDFWNFFSLSFFSFSFLFATVIDLLGLLAVKKLLRKHHRDRQILAWSSQV